MLNQIFKSIIVLASITALSISTLVPSAHGETEEKPKSTQDKNTQSTKPQPAVERTKQLTEAQAWYQRMQTLGASLDGQSSQSQLINAPVTTQWIDLSPTKDLPENKLLIMNYDNMSKPKGNLLVIPPAGQLPTEPDWFIDFINQITTYGWRVYTTGIPKFQLPNPLPPFDRSNLKVSTATKNKQAGKDEKDSQKNNDQPQNTNDSQAQPTTAPTNTTNSQTSKEKVQAVYLDEWTQDAKARALELLKYSATQPQDGKTIILAFGQSAAIASLAASASNANIDGIVLFNLKLDELKDEDQEIINQQLAQQKPVLEMLSQPKPQTEQAAKRRRLAADTSGNRQYLIFELPPGVGLGASNGGWLAKKIHGWAFPITYDE